MKEAIPSSGNRQKQYKYLGWLTAVYITFQLASDISAGMLVSLGPFTVSATAAYFPFTFIIADLLTEVYGYAVARKVVWTVLFCSMLASIIFSLALALPSSPGFGMYAAYASVLGQMPRSMMGSWAAVWCGGIVNDYIMAKMKVLTKGRHLWARTISSTVAGEGVDTLLFYFIALYGIIPPDIFISSVLSGWFLKVAIEVLMTPLTYLVVNWLKKAEDEDYYDDKTDFNPLILK